MASARSCLYLNGGRGPRFRSPYILDFPGKSRPNTLIVWGGEFGRTVYSQGDMTEKDYGRDHHPRCFSIWLSGAGIKGGTTYGETDDFSYNIVKDEVSVHDLHATILHCLGIDHTRLTFRFQGRDHRLTDVRGEVVTPILA